MSQRILLTFLIWLLTYPALILLSAVVVPLMMLNGWQGYTTIFGNYKYGIYGNAAMPCKSFWCAWWFLVIRNPISNFGKQVISVPSTATWPWFYDVHIYAGLRIKAGWKPVADPENDPDRTFVFRPYWSM